MSRIFTSNDVECGNLAEIESLAVQASVRRIIALYRGFEANADPRRKVESAGGKGKAGSKAPARPVTGSRIAVAIRILEECETRLRNELATSTAVVMGRENVSALPETVGGVDMPCKTLDVDATGRGFVAKPKRDEGGKFAPGVSRAHLDAKMREAMGR